MLIDLVITYCACYLDMNEDVFSYALSGVWLGSIMVPLVMTECNLIMTQSGINTTKCHNLYLF